MASEDLRNAKRNKNDEFYTMFNDIQNEINAYLEYDKDLFRGKTVLCPCDDPKWSNFTKFFAANFERFGLKKLISTSYALDSKQKKYANFRQYTLFPDEIEAEAPQYNAEITDERGKKFILDEDINKSGQIDIDDLQWNYLEGDGDFRSDEVKKLRDEADFIITNPPFSMFREFVAWLIESGKNFSIIGNKNAVTYKEVFPLIMQNKIWLGVGFFRGNAFFKLPPGDSTEYAEGVRDEKENTVKFRNISWFTNIEHGRRHEPLRLMTYADNLRFSKHKDFKERGGYLKYDNYDAIDVPYTDIIPDDYEGVMGVPLTYLDKHCPEQFEILGLGTGDTAKKLGITKNYRGRTDLAITINGVHTCPYNRILIRKRKDFEQK